MKRSMNRAAFAKADYNSKYVAVLGYHALQVQKEGVYEGLVMRGKEVIKAVRIVCSNDTENYQVNIDVSKHEEENCGCAKQELSLRPEGYLILMNSGSESNLEFTLNIQGKRAGETVKQTASLQSGDIYACTFLRPGIYEVRFNNKQTTALTIMYPNPKTSRSMAQEPVRVKVGGKGIKEINALPMQGVVFEFESEGQLQVTLKEADQDRNLRGKEIKRYKAATKKKATAPKKYTWRNSKYAS